MAYLHVLRGNILNDPMPPLLLPDTQKNCLSLTLSRNQSPSIEAQNQSPLRESYQAWLMATVASVPQEELSSSRPRRDSFLSSGRGGSGNIRRLSISLDSLGADVIVICDRETPSNSNRFVSSGRGGAGNLRPPSLDLENHPLTAAILSQHVAMQAQYERHIRDYHAGSSVLVRSSGRGGSGNISDLRRTRSDGPSTSKGCLVKGRVKAMLHGNSGSDDVQTGDRNGPNRRVGRRCVF
ncbi:hypothetical protein BU15DRAFT_64630 [Melanogaster broomeanus]|nr:hypothetical protein BU15DRAFT_64630 [Melanogaster broomeanus]